MADLVEAAELLDIDVDHVARGALARNDHRLSRLQVAHPVQPQAWQDATDSRRRYRQVRGDLFHEAADREARGWLCSFPTCRTPTIGTPPDAEGEINIGTAAHICAAAPGRPRYDETMSPEERSSANNGICMCRDHGNAIDSTDSEFTVERLRESGKRDDEWSDGF
jgi:hypothetical protein